MKIKEVASKINGRQYRNELTQEIIKELKDNGLVAVFGASDDLCEFEGVYSDEKSAWDGTTHYFNGKRFINPTDDEEECSELTEACFFIEQIWCPDNKKSWGFRTNIPNAEKFIIMEDDEEYGEGLIFKLTDLINETLIEG